VNYQATFILLQYLPRDRLGGFRNPSTYEPGATTRVLRLSGPGVHPLVFVWMGRGLSDEVHTLDELIRKEGRYSKVEKPMTGDEVERELALLEDATCF